MKSTYAFDSTGNLLHYIGEELRATVPAHAIADYQAHWPDAPDHA
ncbi:MAG TPA: hypothetical protein VIE69_07000 [Methylophilaceae bacterium]|jgi:hypothetical protein